MQIDTEQLITVVAWLLAAIGFLYSMWPLFVKALQVYQDRFSKARPRNRAGQRSETLSPYDELVKLLNDDIQVVSLLLQKLEYQVPDQTQDWYSRMALKQMQVWIVSKIAADRNDPGFGERQLAKYRAKYCDQPNWWVYRQLAIDYRLFRDGFDRTPSNSEYRSSPFTNVGNP